ncbi:MAG: sigma-70 family RNA polymerase sigma factor [Oscillospiraceae bacterium]|nr:sigma-70 family RNA polymerase sigma factor [Oscillospiraceae bacterium]
MEDIKTADRSAVQSLNSFHEMAFSANESSQFIDIFSELDEIISRQVSHERTTAAMEDRKIVELYFKRDENAIRQTQRKFGKRIVNISKHITGSALTAEEVENDTYLRAWESIPPTDPASYLFAFLARIARNISISLCRERSALKRDAVLVELSNEMAECLPTSCSIEEEAEADMVLELINKFLFSKTEDKRNIFMRRYWYLDSVSDIAKRFGQSESSVKTTLFRLRNELREYLAEQGITV